MVGIIGAMEIETQGIIDKMTCVERRKTEKFEFCKGRLCGKETVVCKCGIGKVNSAAAAAVMINTYPEISLVISVGVAGGINPNVRQGDIVIGERTVYHDYDATADGVEKGRVSDYDFTYFQSDSESVERMRGILENKGIKCYVGVIATGDMFVGSNEKSEQIRAEFGADACDMESAAIAQAAYLMNRKFFSMRAISDNGNDGAIEDFYSFVTKAAKVSTDAIIGFIQNF